MRYYIFVTKISGVQNEFKQPCRDDLSARKIAQSNSTVIRVETENTRVVYRKPMTEAEMTSTLRGRG